MSSALRHLSSAIRLSSFVLLICLLAFGLRVYCLGAQSLWYDEGLSVYLAGLPVRDAVTQSAVTDHPPLHALLLGAWMNVAGRSEFAVRFLSVWWSVLAVALIWRVGRELLTDAIGALGALLLAASAMNVWYAQETRGYSLLLALTLGATWAFVEAVRRLPEGTLAAGQNLRTVLSRLKFESWYLIFGIAALYTHYYAAFTLLALNVAFLAVLACKMQDAGCKTQEATGSTPHVSRFTFHASRSNIVRLTHDALHFYLPQLVLVIAFAPWLPAAVRQATTNVTYFPGRVGWQTVVGDTLNAFVSGDVAAGGLAAIAVGVMSALVALGALAEQPGTTRLKRVIAALLMAAPVAAMAAIAWQKPKFAPRYLIAALPAFYLLAGAGLTALWSLFSTQGRQVARTQRIGQIVVRAGVLVCAGLLVVTNAASLGATYFDPDRQRPDVRRVAAHIAANEQPGDVIVLLSGHQSTVFDLYYAGRNAIVPLPEGVMPPAQSPLDYAAAQQLEQVGQGHSHLWLVLWQSELADPTGVVMSELLQKSRRLGVGQDFHDVSLLLFDLQGHAPFGGEPQYPLDARFAEPIALAGYDLETTPRAPGETIDLALYWRAEGRIAGNYQVFTHLLAPDGRLAAGDDHIAGADSYPTSLWTNGAFIRNTFALRIPPDAAPGAYTVQVGLYDSQGRLSVNGQNHLSLGQVVVK